MSARLGLAELVPAAPPAAPPPRVAQPAIPPLAASGEGGGGAPTGGDPIFSPPALAAESLHDRIVKLQDKLERSS